MIINHNISALDAHRLLTENAQNSSTVTEKLSSGVRINRAADDAAGLSVSEKMRSQIRGLNMAYRNAQDGVSLVQTTEGYLQETTAAIQRMRELSVQAANGIYTNEDRKYIQSEMHALTQEVERIANQAEFNGAKLFLGNFGSETSASKLNANEGKPTAEQPLTNPTTAGVPLHIGPNMDQRIVVTIGNMTAGALGLADAKQPSTTSKEQMDVVPKIQVDKGPEQANQGIGILDEALKKVNEERTKLGAFQNRLEMAMKGISVASENLSASESRIRDTDMAKEMIDFVRLNILAQSNTSMLAQANLRPQLILRVLG